MLLLLLLLKPIYLLSLTLCVVMSDSKDLISSFDFSRLIFFFFFLDVFFLYGEIGSMPFYARLSNPEQDYEVTQNIKSTVAFAIPGSYTSLLEGYTSKKHLS